MSSRGRKPKPTAAKELAGNPGHRPLNENEPKPKASAARTPRGLGQEGSKFWRKYAPALAGLGILTEIDEPALRMAAEHFDIAVQAATELRRERPLFDKDGAPVFDGDGKQVMVTDGLVIEDKDGNLRKNPLLQILRDNSTALRGYLTEFGMTPSSRSKIKAEPDEQLSLADILFGDAAERYAETHADEAGDGS